MSAVSRDRCVWLNRTGGNEEGSCSRNQTFPICGTANRHESRGRLAEATRQTYTGRTSNNIKPSPDNTGLFCPQLVRIPVGPERVPTRYIRKGCDRGRTDRK